MKLLIAADKSEHSRAALTAVLSSPWPAKTEFMVLSVSETGHPRTEFWNPHQQELLAEAESKAQESLQAVVQSCADELKKRFPDGQVSTQVVDGHAVEKILETAEKWEADLIVLGSHGLKGFRKFLLGSVSEAVASHAHCSVRIVRLPYTGHEGSGLKE